MKKRVVLRFYLLILVMAAGSMLLNGCGKKEVIEIYPPIVFKPQAGELGGGAIADNLFVTTVEMTNGKPVSGARVFVHQPDTLELLADAVTGPDGTVSFAGKGITGPVVVTVTCNENIAYDTVSFVGINAANMVVPLDRRKSPEKVQTALSFIGLDSGDAKLTASQNDVPLQEQPVTAGKIEADPWTVTVDAEPLAFSAFVTDASENTTKFGFTVEPDGPIPVQTPAMIDLVRVSDQNVRICRGKIENPPANLELPVDGWDPFSRYIFQVYSDGGLAGDVVSGFANLDNSYAFQAFVVKTPVLTRQKFEVSAFNRRDAWSEMTSAFVHYTFDTIPQNVDISFIDAPKGLQSEKLENLPLPRLVWSSTEGNFHQVEIYHADYNFRWTLYVAGENPGGVVIPPIEPGSEGSLIIGEIYRFRVISWQVPGFDFNQMSFQKLSESVTHRSRSSMTQFMVATPDKK